MGSCSSKFKVLHQNGHIVPSPSSEWPNRNKYLVTTTEVVALKLIFIDLAGRNHSKTHLSKLTFLKFFQLPVCYIQGMLGEKLFSEFDSDSEGRVNCYGFINQIKEYCRGEYHSVIKKFFDLCKYDQREFITHEELFFLVKHI